MTVNNEIDDVKKTNNQRNDERPWWDMRGAVLTVCVWVCVCTERQRRPSMRVARCACGPGRSSRVESAGHAEKSRTRPVYCITARVEKRCEAHAAGNYANPTTTTMTALSIIRHAPRVREGETRKKHHVALSIYTVEAWWRRLIHWRQTGQHIISI